ncbi:MAG: cytochrome c oxidase assembly protein [Steroidobacteraceae bacterium]
MAEHSEILAAWQFTPPISLGLLLIAYVYLRGLRRRSRAPERFGRWNWRPSCFLAGLLCLYAVLQSPLDFLADHLFFVHQIQHLFLMMIVPILLLAPAPEGELTAGLPSSARRLLLAPIVRNRAIGGVMRCLMHPCTATVLGGGMLYFWMIPGVYDAALSNERIHDLMHLCLLFGGLLFWRRVLDRRRPPVGLSYLTRAGMLKVNLMMVAALGGYLTSKDDPLYRDSGFGLMNITSIVDEQIGGAILWFAGSLILLAAIALTIRKWLVETERIELTRWAESVPDPDFDRQSGTLTAESLHVLEAPAQASVSGSNAPSS